MNTGPLRSYIQARDAFKEGKAAEAAQLLAQSFGADKPTAIMIDGLGPLLDPNEVSLTLILKESKNNG